MVTPERASQLGHDLSLLLDCTIIMLGDTPHIIKCKHTRYSVETLDKMTEDEWNRLGEIHREVYGTGKLPKPKIVVELDRVFTIAPGLDEQKKRVEEGRCLRCGKSFDTPYPEPTSKGGGNYEIMSVACCARCNQIATSALFRDRSAYWDGSIRPPWQQSSLL